MKKGMIIMTVVCALVLAVHLPVFAASGALNMRLTTDTPDVMPQGVAATWFGQEIQKNGVDGLIRTLQAKNKS